MKRNLFLLIGFIGLMVFFTSCEKDETRVIMSDNPVAPTIKEMPNLTFQRNIGNQEIVITGTPVDPGFKASASYFFEVAVAGTNFANPLVLFSGVQVDEMRFKISDLNGLMLRRFPADLPVSADFRIRAILVVDAGASAPKVYISETKTVQITLYGLPRLDLLDSGLTQKIESPLGDGVYSGFVKLDPAKPFKLKDPDANKVYGISGNELALDGGAITASIAGWHKFSADTGKLTFSLDPYRIGLVGSATPNGWDTPDQKMDYDAATGTWFITLDLVNGDIKFRLNDGWAWNLGGTPDKLTQGGDNIPVTAGNYTITLTINTDNTGTYKIVKN
jgi:starch-binding outer membrane protein SusE/F